MKNQQIKVSPRCPFCGDQIEPPRDQEQRKLGEFKVGTCRCGAAYAADATGHNIGSAMIEALVYACRENWDLAWELQPDRDYLTGRVEGYDELTHQVLDQRHLDGRYVRGVLYFVRLQQEATELALSGEKSAPPSATQEPELDPNRKRRRADKQEVQQLALAGDFDTLAALALDDVRTLRFLQRLLYAPDEDQRWWVAHVIGQVSARLANRKPGAVSDLLHRLFDASSDSAAANWGLVEAMGSIIAARPDIYGAFARHLLRYINHVSTRHLVLWALGTVAARSPDLVRANQFYDLFNLLNDPDPQVRAMTTRLMGRTGAHEVKSRLEALVRDTTPVTVYEDGRRQETTISRLAAEALAQLPKAEVKQP